MKSPTCVSKICVTNRRQTASFSIVGSMLAIAPLWPMLAAPNPPGHAQTPDTVSNLGPLHLHPRTGRSSTGTTCSAGIRMRPCLVSTAWGICR